MDLVAADPPPPLLDGKQLTDKVLRFVLGSRGRPRRDAKKIELGRDRLRGVFSDATGRSTAVLS